MWSLSEGHPVLDIPLHGYGGYAYIQGHGWGHNVKFSPDNSRILSSSNGGIKVWCMKLLPVHVHIYRVSWFLSTCFAISTCIY